MILIELAVAAARQMKELSVCVQECKEFTRIVANFAKKLFTILVIAPLVQILGGHQLAKSVTVI